MDTSHKVYANKLWSFIAPSVLRKSFIEPRRNTSVAFDAERNLFLLDAGGRLAWQKALDDDILDAKILNDGSNVAVLAKQGAVLLFRDDGTLVRRTPVSMDACFLEVQTQGTVFAVAAHGSRCIVFTTLGRKIAELSARHQVVSLCMAQREGSLILADNYYKISYFQQSRAAYALQWELELKCILGTPVCNATGSLIVIPAYQNGAYVLDRWGNFLGAYSAGEMVTLAAMDEEGELLVLANAKHEIVVITRKGHVLGLFDMGDEIVSISLNAYGRRLLVLTETGQVNCFELSAGQKGLAGYLELKPQTGPEEPIPKSPLWTKEIFGKLSLSRFGEVILSGDGKRICLSEGNRAVRFIENTGEVSSQVIHIKGAHPGHTLTEDGRTIFFFSDNGLRKIDMFSGRHSFKEKKYFLVKECVASKKGDAVLVCNEFNEVRLYDAALEEIHHLSLNEEIDVIRCDFDKRLMYLACDGTRLKAVDFKGEVLFESVFEEDEISSMVLLPGGILTGLSSGKLVAFDGEGSRLWQKNTGEPITRLECLDRDVIIYFSDGSLAVLDFDGARTVRKRDALEHSLVFKWRGALFEAGYEDRFITVLDIAGEIVWRYVADDFVKSLSVSGDGVFLAALDARNLYYFSTGRDEVEYKPYNHLEFEDV
jgi:outer membrane protein assembly factor BamB